MSGGSDEIRRFFVKCSWNSKNVKKNLDSENTFYGFYSIFSHLTIYKDFVDFIFQDLFLDIYPTYNSFFPLHFSKTEAK